jgi:hypothetical protein
VAGDDRFSEFEGNSVSHNNHPLGRTTRIATNGALLIVASGEFLGYDVFAASGRLLSSTRVRTSPRPVTARVIEDLITAWQSTSGSPLEIEQFIRRMPMPAQLPAVDRLHVDASGNVWMRAFTVDEPDQATWHVFDTAGETYFGSVRVSRRLQVTDIGRDYLMGIGTTDDGGEQIQIFRLKR